MLGKLTKYEIKSTASTFLLIYAAVLILAVINRVFYGFGFFNSVSVGNTTFASQFGWIGDLFTTLFTMLYILMIIAMFVAVMIVVILRFYRNMFGSEGYLMHTLPVKPWQHIVSKMLGSALWMAGSFVTTALSLVVLLSHKQVYMAITYAWGEITTLLEQYGFSLTPFIIEYVVIIVISMFTFSLVIYACICIGQLWRGHRVLGAFLAYMAINFINQIISGICSVFFVVPFSRAMENIDTNNVVWVMTEVTSYLNNLMIFSTVFSLVISVAYFLVCNYIMKKKLDLE
jgi:hypothetical protein